MTRRKHWFIGRQVVLASAVGCAALGCTVRHTPAESTPVYADALPDHAAPVTVERVSIDEPDPTLVNGHDVTPGAESNAAEKQPPAPGTDASAPAAEETATSPATSSTPAQ